MSSVASESEQAKELPHLDRIGLRKLGNPPGFAFCEWRSLDDGTIVLRGGVYRLRKSGPRKGQPTWKGSKLQSVAVTTAEIRDEEKRFTAETGKCHRCLGTGLLFASWSTEEGVKRRPCGFCAGTGKAAQAEVR
jgi:hypothetical protein